jgi:hypothetical protein
MMDLLKLDIAIAEAREFLSLAREAGDKLHTYNDSWRDKYPIDECAKVRAKSLDLYRSLVDLRRKEERKNV